MIQLQSLEIVFAYKIGFQVLGSVLFPNYSFPPLGQQHGAAPGLGKQP